VLFRDGGTEQCLKCIFNNEDPKQICTYNHVKSLTYKRAMLRKFRLTFQIVFFILFCVCFFLLDRYPFAYHYPADFLLRLNPLVALLAETAARAFIPSLLAFGIATAVLTLIFGRVFCGFICPLGTSIDFFDTVIFNKSRFKDRRPPRFFQRFKYMVLFTLIALSLFGALFPLFMDPVSLLTRITTVIINPLLSVTGMNSLALASPLLNAAGIEKFQSVTISVPFFYGIFSALLLLTAVFAGSVWDRRFWCQYICPSGAFFALLSRWPLFRRLPFATGCSSCYACSRVCPVRAIDPGRPERTNTAECIVCGLCTQIKVGCSSFRFSVPGHATQNTPDLNKRHFVFGALGGLLLVPVFKATAVGKSDGRGRLVRPPGAIPEDDFLARCIACGNCMKACPTNALQPCTSGDGFNRLFTPRLVPRIGACDSRCRLCGFVCPTKAIRRLSAGEKPYVKIGTAVVDTHRCLAWEQNRECLVCDEVCPYNAIEVRQVLTAKGPFRVPIVKEDLCVGCGMCEKQCPVFDRGAIEVYRFGETRLSEGPYASDSRKRRIDLMRKSSDSNTLSVPGDTARSSGISE
jgi:MauM/NapG family ferredoxin protein